MEAEMSFFERYHGVSSLLQKGMPSDILFEGKTFNVEAVRKKYIPYSCRCEAIGGGRDKGLLYRGLDGAWDVGCKENSRAERRFFKLPASWKGLRLYLVADRISPKTTVYINGALACFCFDSERDYIESEITAHVNFDTDNEIVIISEEADDSEACSVYIVARKFVHIRDYSCTIDEKSVALDIRMSRNIPAKVLAEVYDEDLNLIASSEKELIGKGTIRCDISSAVRLILLVCGEEVIPVPTDLHTRPDLPCGENIEDYESGSAREFTVDTIDLEQGIFDIEALGDCKTAKLSYKVFAENGVLCEREIAVNFSNGNICRVMTDEDIPSLSFYEYFIDFKINGEFVGQYKLPVRQTACERTLSSDMPAFDKVDISGSKVFVSGVNFENVFDVECGCIEKMSKEGCDVLKGHSAILFGGVYAEHIRSSVMSRDNHHIGISSVYLLKKGSETVSLSVLTILYSNGEISISVSGIAENNEFFAQDPIVLTFPVSDKLLDTKLYGEANICEIYRSGVYDSVSDSDKSFKNCRWIYVFGKRLPGLFIKGLPFVNAVLHASSATKNISRGISITVSPDDSGMIATSFVLKAVFCENEDIIREARIIPFVSD